MSISIKRVYDPAAPSDGVRVLIDRLWPRGRSKAEAKVDHWMKQLAPSTELREWFGHDPQRWEQFKRKYSTELSRHPDEISELKRLGRGEHVTLLYGARDEEHNNAVALKEYLRNPGKRTSKSASKSAAASTSARSRKKRAPAGRTENRG